MIPTPLLLDEDLAEDRDEDLDEDLDEDRAEDFWYFKHRSCEVLGKICILNNFESNVNLSSNLRSCSQCSVV